MKKDYVDLIEAAVNAYTPGQIADYIASVEEDIIREHGFPRLTANIGRLLSEGRRPDLRETFVHMMDLSTEMAHRNLAIAGGRTGNDFSVRELCLCLWALEEKKTFEEEDIRRWRENLKKIDPYTTYRMIAKVPPERIGNWALFAAVSEQARLFIGVGGNKKFIDDQIASQLLSLDENGMYRDPEEPMVYDVVPRMLFGTILTLGYDGVHKRALEEALERSARPTLLMQSVTGELAYGGRSNQFLHNEAALAALDECYAGYYREKDPALAGAFKRAARLARNYTQNWIRGPYSHIKNHYPIPSSYGCEGYAYFNKYMVTMGSFYDLAHLHCREDIPEAPCPAETGGATWETGACFHKLFLNSGAWFAEYDTDANFHYDANGLGRLHRKGAPSALILTLPFPVGQNYTLDQENPMPLSLTVGVTEVGADGKTCYRTAAEKGSAYRLLETDAAPGAARSSYEITLPGGELFREDLHLGESEALLSAYHRGEFLRFLPLSAFDGREEAKITCETEGDVTRLRVHYQGWTATFETKGKVTDTGLTFANRSGHYRLWTVSGRDEIQVRITAEKDV